MNQLRRGYPLGALFVLVAACAVLIAGAAPYVQLVAQTKADFETLLAALVIGGGCGLVLGIILGLHHFRRALGTLVGAGAGTVIGATAGLITLLPADRFLTVAAAMSAGSGLIVVVAVLMGRGDS
jgi:hypothetical protein